MALGLPTPQLTDLCVLLNGVDPCSVTALTSLDALNACTGAGGTLPTNLVGCATAGTATDAVTCIQSCNGLLDTLLLVETCQTNGGSPAAALLDCSNFVINVAGVQSDVLADVCVLLGGGNPCSGTAISNGALPTDLTTYLADCALGGFLSATLQSCLLTANTDADRLLCASQNP